MWIYGLTCHLKCTFNSILEEKKQQNFSCVSYMKRLRKCLYSKKPPLPWKIHGYASAYFKEYVQQEVPQTLFYYDLKLLKCLKTFLEIH